METHKRLRLTMVFVVLVVISISMISPFLWMLSSSVKTIGQMMSVPIHWLPWPPMWKNYPQALATIPFWHQLRNTVFLAVMTVIGTVVSSSMVSYGFAKIAWPGRQFFFGVLLASMFLPGVVTFIPTYIIFRNLGWLNTYLPLIVPSFLGVPFYIFMLRQFFLSVPETISEAARVDGASEFRIYWQIIMPTAQPALTAVAILSFVGAWTDYMGPLIYLNLPSEWTLSLGLNEFLSQHSAEWNLLMAAAVVFTVPLIAIFFFGQRYFMKGITFTGDVG